MALCRQLFKTTLTNYRFGHVINRSFMMSSNLRAEEAIDELKKKNPYYEKYAAKLAALKQTSPDEFVQRLDSVGKTKKPAKEEKPR